MDAPSGISCEKCNTQAQAGAKFCAQCGTPIAKPSYCTQCGKKYSPDSTFCDGCGNRISEEPGKPPQPPEANPMEVPSGALSQATQNTASAMVLKRIPWCEACDHPGEEDGLICVRCGKALAKITEPDAQKRLAAPARPKTPRRRLGPPPAEEPEQFRPNILCRHCAAVNPPHANFCKKCGNETELLEGKTIAEKKIIAEKLMKASRKRLLTQSEADRGYCDSCRIKLIVQAGNRTLSHSSYQSTIPIRRLLQGGLSLGGIGLICLRALVREKILPLEVPLFVLLVGVGWTIVDITVFGRSPQAALLGKSENAEVMACPSCGAWKPLGSMHKTQ